MTTTMDVLCGMLTIQYSVRSARLSVQSTVYFLHSTMPSVTYLRLSDVSVICRVNYLQFLIQACFFSTSVSQAAQRSGVLALPNIGHRTSPKIFREVFLY